MWCSKEFDSMARQMQSNKSVNKRCASVHHILLHSKPLQSIKSVHQPLRTYWTTEKRNLPSRLESCFLHMVTITNTVMTAKLFGTRMAADVVVFVSRLQRIREQIRKFVLVLLTKFQLWGSQHFANQRQKICADSRDELALYTQIRSSGDSLRCESYTFSQKTVWSCPASARMHSLSQVEISACKRCIRGWRAVSQRMVNTTEIRTSNISAMREEYGENMPKSHPYLMRSTSVPTWNTRWKPSWTDSQPPRSKQHRGRDSPNIVSPISFSPKYRMLWLVPVRR